MFGAIAVMFGAFNLIDVTFEQIPNASLGPAVASSPAMSAGLFKPAEEDQAAFDAKSRICSLSA